MSALPANDRPLWAALLLIAALWLATALVDQPPAAKPADAPADQFSGQRARARLQLLLGDGSAHPTGSPGNAQLRARIVQQLQGLGYSPQLQAPQLVCGQYASCAVPYNIVARLTGSDPNAPAVLLAAHYDSVAAGAGASDDGSGVAAVLEIAAVLRQRAAARRSIIFLLDDAEEPGLLGAEAFVQHHPWASSVAAAVNLDARGTSGPSLLFETGTANQWLMQRYAQAIARPLANSVYYAVYQRLPNDTDFTVFKRAGYQGFNFAFIGDVMRYHTGLDDWAHVDARSLQHQGDSALASLWSLANAASLPTAGGEAVYFDLFRAVLVRWPQRWALPLAWLALLLTLGCVWRVRRTFSMPAVQLAWGAAQLLVTLLGVWFSASALLWLLARAGASPPPPFAFIAHAWTLQLAFAALALLVTTQMAARFGQRAGAWGLWCATALLFTGLAWALSAWLVGASYLLLLPAAAMCLASASMLRLKRRSTPALIGVVGLGFALLFPVELPLYSALGSAGLRLQSLLLALFGFSALSLWCAATPRLQRICSWGAGSALAVGLLGALLAPAYTASSPQRLNLHYLLAADSGAASWLLDAASRRLPASFSGAPGFASTALQMNPWNNVRQFSAPAPALTLLPPTLQLLNASCPTPGVQATVHLTAGLAGADESLLTDRDVRVQFVSAPPGEDNAIAARSAAVGASRWRFIAVPAAGLTLTLQSDKPTLELEVVERRSGLPPQARALAQTRATLRASAYQDGDSTLIARRLSLRPCGSGS